MPQAFARQISCYPFLRLVLPLMAGIGVGEVIVRRIAAQTNSDIFLTRIFWAGAGVLLVLLMLLLILYRSKLHAFSTWIFGILSTFFFIVLGAWADVAQWRSVWTAWPDAPSGYEAVVCDTPKEKARTWLCPVVVTARLADGKRLPIHRQAYLYLPKDERASRLAIGDAVRFAGELQRPRNNGNPGEFDYAGYLLRHQVEATAFVRASTWKTVAKADVLPVSCWQRMKMAALTYRARLLDTYRSNGLAEDELGVLAAMTLGDKSWLSSEMRELYSSAGASHVLALSGLHLGILYMVLNLILLGKWRTSRFRWVSQSLIITALWMFVFLTGFPISLVRSATMYSLLSVGVMVGRKSVSLNTLALAAFVILLANPFALFDVGFQLSFLAVLFILILDVEKWGIRLPRQPVLRYFCSLLAVSVSAQVGVGALVVFYFHRFPTYFLLTNLLVIPLAFVLVSGALLFFVLGVWPWAQGMVGMLLGKVVAFMNVGLQALNGLPGASIGSLYPSWIDVVGYYVVLALLLMLIRFHRVRYVKGILLTVAVFVWMGVFVKLMSPRRSMLFIYNNRACPAVHFVASSTRSYLLTNRTDSVAESFAYIAENFWAKEKMAQPEIVSANYADTLLCVRNGVAAFGNRIVVMVDGDTWRNLSASKPLAVDFLYLSRGFKGTAAGLQSVFSPRMVVLDASLGDWRITRLQHECDSLGLSVHSLRDDGALQVPLNEK